jgi:purine-binding chemotaxis protein CheW
MIKQLVVFRLCRKEYAVLIEKVKEVINYVPVTRLPGTPACFEGAINVRGRVVPVVDFAAKIGLKTAEGANRQIVIVETEGKEIGLVVDAVTEVVQTMSEKLVGVETAETGNDLKKTYKFHERVIILLNLERVVSGSALAV